MEYELIKDQLTEIDVLVNKGMTELTWNSAGKIIIYILVAWLTPW